MTKFTEKAVGKADPKLDYLVAKTFNFRTRIKDINGYEIECLCTCFDNRSESGNRSEFDFGHFSSELVNSLRKTPGSPDFSKLPEVLIIIIDSTHGQSVEKHKASFQNEIKDIQKRGDYGKIYFIKNYILLKWEDNNFVEIFSEFLDPKCNIDAGKNSKDIIYSGIKKLISDNNVIKISPSGYRFTLPSGNHTQYFFHFRDITVNDSQHWFVAKTIRHKLIEILGLEKFKAIRVVFIDTNGIYSYVREAFEDIDIRIHSHSSYNLVDLINKPNLPYISLISVSETGTLAKKLASLLEKNNVFSILGNKTALPNSLINLKEILDDSIFSHIINFFSPQPQQVNNYRSIKMLGEFFTPSGKEPRSVTVSKKDQEAFVKSSLGYIHNHYINVNFSGEETPNSFNNSFFKLENNDNKIDNGLNDWIDDQVKYKVPHSVNLIINVDDELNDKKLSSSMSERVMDELNKSKKDSVRIIKRSELKDEYNKNKDLFIHCTGVVICCGFSYNGLELRDIARALREYIDSTKKSDSISKYPIRHYLVGVFVYDNNETHESFKSFIQMLVPNYQNQFGCFQRIVTGDVISHNGWYSTSLDNNIYKFITKDCINSPILKLESTTENEKYLKQYNKTGLSINQIKEYVDCLESFFGEIKSNKFLKDVYNRNLNLTEGFVFAPPENDNKSPYSDEFIFLTLSSILQICRDKTSDKEGSLSSTDFEPVVLSHENFLRYNDSILQASFLRAAHYSELEYSQSNHESLFFKNMLLDIFSNPERPSNSGCLEFALAIAMKKLVLVDSHMDSLLSSSICKLHDKINKKKFDDEYLPEVDNSRLQFLISLLLYSYFKLLESKERSQPTGRPGAMTDSK
ncbi:MAG: hypothetical protein QM537_02635 [Candidatus Symbiobacter sp.]|nr:hypothetical protein [Candidatus Symbiobacter sp.]